MESDNKKNQQVWHADPKDHLANERTFLAWIRTSIGIMAFGFVVEKFALFIKQIDIVLGKQNPSALLHSTSSLQGYSSIFGVFLVAIGVIIALLAFLNYKKVQQQIESKSFEPSNIPYLLLTLSVLIIGIFLVFYLGSNT